MDIFCNCTFKYFFYLLKSLSSSFPPPFLPFFISFLSPSLVLHYCIIITFLSVFVVYSLYGVPSPPKFNVAFYILLFAFYPILILFFGIRVFVILLSSCNIQVFALYIHLFVRDIFKFTFKFSGLYFQVFAFNIDHLAITCNFALYLQLFKLYFHRLVIHLW